MKANGAPEKLWIDPTNDLPKLSGHIDKGSVEYTRTDVFIEKAVNFLNCSLSGIVAIKDGNITQGLLRTKSEFIEKFISYMKGE